MGLVAGPRSFVAPNFTGGATTAQILVIKNTLGAKCIVVRMMGGNSTATVLPTAAGSFSGALPALNASVTLVCIGFNNPTGAGRVDGTGPVGNDGYTFLIVADLPGGSNSVQYGIPDIPYSNVLLTVQVSANVAFNVEAFPLYEKNNPSIGTGGKLGVFNEG